MRYVCAPIVEAFPPSTHFSPSLQHRSHYSSFLARPFCTSLTAVFLTAEASHYLRLLVSRLATFSMLLLPRQGSLRSSLPLRLHLPQSNGLGRAIWFSLAYARSCANQQYFLILQLLLHCAGRSHKASLSIFLIQKSLYFSCRSCRNSLTQVAAHQRCSRSSWDQHLY